MSAKTKNNAVETECRANRGETAAAQCEKHYKAAGARLAILKANKPKDVTWPEVCEACGLSKSRANQLIALAQDRVTLRDARDANAEANRQFRERPSRDVHLAKVPTDDPPCHGLAQGRVTLEGERAARAAERPTRVGHLAKVPTDDPALSWLWRGRGA